MRDYRELISDRTLYFASDVPFQTELGALLPEVRIAYRTWGTLNASKNNVILICHALTGSADADFWWKGMFAEGGAFDETENFIICSNVLGSCYGTTGPISPNPLTGRRYGSDFPLITIRDMVNLQHRLLDELGIAELQLVVGASLGGMQVLEWGFLYPGMVKAMMPMGISGRHSAWCIAQSEAQRQAIYADRDWRDGWYREDAPPAGGFAAARMMAMCSYRSYENFQTRFGRNQTESSLYEVENYLHHQGEKLVERFDANTYITLTKAMDTHDVARGRGAYEDVLGSLRIPVEILSINSDVLYPKEEQEELARLIPTAGIIYLEEPYGHDAFLIDTEKVSRMVREFMNDRASGGDQDVS
ncbi:homoserine O-acetyltransferase MetX [Chlorobium phaeobacteroides]|uniref:Homoserine O-acetyltransferase n=1 Tax=Chlorobium phaeobacteroides (strain DSM 266 / SMG 266 / 2430) TaxID=290317 RepID=A1BHA6_CHLPD|nr:homoserine O-acetyltransferase [Chlorobium phaeobacteroides]ABL65783.1 homoserine O-acetyltransferase [Chlorobium phaeobacteroides DSM 266]